MRTLKYMMIFSGALFLVSCASNVPKQKSNLTHATVKSKIIEGYTNQSEVLTLIGNPNIITRSSRGEEVWSYSKQSIERKSGGSFFWLGVIGGNQAFSSNSSATMDLIITFNEDDIVKKYSVVSSQF